LQLDGNKITFKIEIRPPQVTAIGLKVERWSADFWIIRNFKKPRKNRSLIGYKTLFYFAVEIDICAI